MTKKTPQEIWNQHAAGHPNDTGHSVQDGRGVDRDFVHDGDDSWERKSGEDDWNRVPHITEGI